MNFSETACYIISLFNHSLTYSDKKEISHLFSTVRHSKNADTLALQVTDTLEYRVSEFDTPFCSERQAMALAFVFDTSR